MNLPDLLALLKQWILLPDINLVSMTWQIGNSVLNKCKFNDLEVFYFASDKVKGTLLTLHLFSLLKLNCMIFL